MKSGILSLLLIALVASLFCSGCASKRRALILEQMAREARAAQVDSLNDAAPTNAAKPATPPKETTPLETEKSSFATANQLTDSSTTARDTSAKSQVSAISISQNIPPTSGSGISQTATSAPEFNEQGTGKKSSELTPTAKIIPAPASSPATGEQSGVKEGKNVQISVRAQVEQIKLLKDNQYEVECRILDIRVPKGNSTTLHTDDVIILKPTYDLNGKWLVNNDKNKKMLALRSFAGGSFFGAHISYTDNGWIIEEVL